MVTRASISFEHPATDSPIYVVTEMSTPPWEPLEMRDSGEKTETGDVIFIRNFEDVAEGSYQYKIRIGDSDWVLDTTKDTGNFPLLSTCDCLSFNRLWLKPILT